MTAFSECAVCSGESHSICYWSVELSKVYILNDNGKHRVESVRIEYINKAGTANEIFKDVLGITATYGGWVENHLEEIAVKYANRRHYRRLR